MAGANKVVTLIGQVILAWILVPKDMGLAGMAIAMAGFALFLGAPSVGDVLVQRGHYKEEAGQAFWFSLFLSVSTSILIGLLYPVAILIGRPDLSKMLLVLAFLPLADFMSPTLTSALKTNLEFKRLAVAQFVASVTYTVCAVILAFLGLGPFALILPVIPRALMNNLVMLTGTGFPPIERPKFSRIKPLIKPALSLSLTSFLTGLQMQGPVFFIGLLMDPASTGRFSWGWMVAGQAVFLLSVNLRQVLMPVIAKMSGEPYRQAAAALRAARAITAVLMITCCFQALLIEPILNRFFPEKWHAAGPVVVWISIGLAFQGIYICVVSWLNGIGKYRELLLLSALPVVLASGLAYFGASLKGINGASEGACIGLVMSAMAALFFMPIQVLKNQTKNLVTPILVTLGIWFVIYFAFPDNKNLIIETAISLVFLAISIFAWRHWSEEGVKEIWSKFFEKMKFSDLGEDFKNAVKPNFFIIGAPKCGTTALSEYLKENPHVFMSSPKETEYFSFDLSNAAKMSLKTYLSIFSKANPEVHKAIGEASTAYLYSKCAVPEILKFNPEAKFIVMIRNPIDLVQSLHAQMLYQGIETVSDFETAWKLEENRKEGNDIPMFCFDKNSLMYSEWGLLGKQIERLFSIVRRDKVKVIIFDEFIKNTKQIYEEVLEFLGAPSDGRVLFPKFNEGKSISVPFLQPILGFPIKMAKATRAIVGYPKSLDFFIGLLALNSNAKKRPSITKEFKKELISFFREDIEKLSVMLNINLSFWNL